MGRAISGPRLQTESLAYSLRCAAHAVAKVKSGTALPQALAAVFAHSEATPQARGATQDIAYRSMRQLGRAEALLGRLANKAPAQPELHALLCCALALLCGDEESPDVMPYEAFTVVDQAVNAAAADAGIAHAKGMVNAVLRRYLREREALLQAVMQQPAARWNYPSWWIAATQAAYPDQWQSILQNGNRTPPLTLRVNRRKTSATAYLQMLDGHGIPASCVGPDAVMLAHALPVERIPGFAQGLVSVQDAAAQLAAPLLDVHDGMRVLDACAAPGGKTGHLLECAAVDLLALDSDTRRLGRVEENLQRLELDATLRTGDAAGNTWWDGNPFDRILADVPCTASGIVRRHPDIRWLRRDNDAAQLAAVSARILDNLWQMLRPDGKLLFVTCSIWPSESELQAAAFGKRHNALRLPAPGQLLPTVDVDRNHDGLFYALFQKTAV